MFIFSQEMQTETAWYYSFARQTGKSIVGLLIPMLARLQEMGELVGG